MELTVFKATDEMALLALNGRLDVVGVRKIELQFLAHTAGRKTNVILDLSGVTFIASMAIGMLLSSAKSLRASNAKLVLLNPQPIVLEILRAGGLDKVLPIAHDEQSAIKLLKA